MLKLSDEAGPSGLAWSQIGFPATNRAADVREAILWIQGWCCDICGTGLNDPQLDHDHSNGLIRGALCTHCNTRLAAVEDQEWLANAHAYLDYWRTAHELSGGVPHRK